jgi:hypothetical protein
MQTQLGNEEAKSAGGRTSRPCRDLMLRLELVDVLAANDGPKVTVTAEWLANLAGETDTDLACDLSPDDLEGECAATLKWLYEDGGLEWIRSMPSATLKRPAEEDGNRLPEFLDRHNGTRVLIKFGTVQDLFEDAAIHNRGTAMAEAALKKANGNRQAMLVDLWSETAAE